MRLFKELTLSTLLVAIFCSLGGVSFGIDYGYWSGMLGMTQFIKDFGVYDPDTDSYILPSSWKSAGSGLPIAGLAVGSLVSGFVGNHLGRIRTFQLSTFVSIIGIVIQSAAIHSYWQIVPGRIITTLALGTLANTIPAYLAEVSPLSIRGTLVNCYQFSIGVGAVLVNTGNWGMHNRTDQWAYRLVIMLQAVIPIIFISGSFFIPESPRWLLGKGRRDDAHKALEFLRTNTPRELIEEEVRLIMNSEEENSRRFDRSWKGCFKGSNLRRTLIVTGVQCLQQAQGNSFMGSYSLVFFQSIGVHDVYKIHVLFLFCMAISSASAFYLPDRFGRRWIMIFCALIMGTCMYVVSGITGFGLADDANAMKGAVAALFIWQFAMSVGWSSCVWIITAEVPSLQLREKTITVATFSGFCISILITFVSPFIQDKGYGGLEGRIGFLYGGFSFAAAVWALLFLPETGSRSLEELDELFQNSVSVWKFRKYQTSGYGAQLAQIEGEVYYGYGEELPGKEVPEDMKEKE